MARRSKARQVALQMLFQCDLNPQVDGATVREQIREQLKDDDLKQFAWRIFAGVMELRPLLDQRIMSVAENWTLERMAPTDRNVLRIGLFEIEHTDTPYRVAIDEAIELARKFGSVQSAPFVNGLLDKLAPGGGTNSGDAPESE